MCLGLSLGTKTLHAMSNILNSTNITDNSNVNVDLFTNDWFIPYLHEIEQVSKKTSNLDSYNDVKRDLVKCIALHRGQSSASQRHSQVILLLRCMKKQ